MKKILIILTGVLLVCSEPVIAKNEITIASTIKVAKNALKNKKTVQKKKKILSKSKKKVVTKKKIQKKRKKVVRTRVRYNVGEIQSYAHSLVLSYGWTEEDYNKLVLLWYRESSWNPNAYNKKSTACGIAQAKPCSKTNGTDYRTNWKTQVKWGLNYIKARYGTPANAWSHSQQKGWY